MSIIVYGPRGCGKTLNAARLRDFFKLRNFHDQYPNPYGRLHASPAVFNAEAVLYLTHEEPPEHLRNHPKVVRYSDAMRLMGKEQA